VRWSWGLDWVKVGGEWCGGGPYSPGPGLVSALRTAGRQADPLEYHVCPPEQGLGWRPLFGPFHLVLSEGEAGPRSRCLIRPESTGSQALSRSSVSPASGQGSSTLRWMIVPSPVRRSSQVTYTDGEPGGSSRV